jgi:PKHD-type hydroxylase
MHCQVFRILEPSEVRHAVAGLANAVFVDGRKTATGTAKEVKHNLQVDRSGPDLSDLDRLILRALKRNEAFQIFAFPRRVMAPAFSRYEVGMQYGAHVDSALMYSGAEPMRTDLAITIFLSEPASYDGGELVIELPFGEQEIKLEAGEAIVYSATSRHRVAPVTRGTRLVALTWVQSTVRDDGLRAIIADLGAAIPKAGQAGDAELVASLTKSYHNLLRYAVEL